MRVLCSRTRRSFWSMAPGPTVRVGTTSFSVRRQGLKVICAPIPLTSLTEDIAALNGAHSNERVAPWSWPDTPMQAR